MSQFSFHPFPILSTVKLLLRQLTLNDALSIFKYRSNKENFPYVDMRIYTDIAEAKAYIEIMNTEVKENKEVIWAITDKNTNQVLGTISIWNINAEKNLAELGYGLFPEYRGNGIMSQALAKVVDYGFNNMGLKTIEAWTDSLNNESKALLERNKFIKTSSVVENTSNGGSTIMDIYSRDAEG
ncbi:GNAT family N-acetyltransferase [Fredinandcohnia humi]